MMIATTDLAQPNPVCVGVDVGQIHDPSAVAVAEVVRVHTGKYRYGKQYHIPAHIDANLIFPKPQDAEPFMRSRNIVRHTPPFPLAPTYPNISPNIAHILSNTHF